MANFGVFSSTFSGRARISLSLIHIFYLALLYADKDFGGEADEPVFQPQLVQGFGVEMCIRDRADGAQSGDEEGAPDYGRLHLVQHRRRI